MEVAEPALLSAPPRRRTPGLRRGSEEQVRVKRQTLQTVLEQCQSALELLKTAGQDPDPALEAEDAEEDKAATNAGEPCDNDRQTDELCELIKSKLDSPDFLDKFGSIHMSVCHDISDNSASWDVVSPADLWENEHVDGDNDSDQEDYVLVSQEDIVEGIASYMAAYLLSLKQTKVLSPNQLQEALSKTFSVKKKKSKLRKAWNGSKVIYNVASWGATAIGLYQNPAVFRVASVAFSSSCHVISKLF